MACLDETVQHLPGAVAPFFRQRATLKAATLLLQAHLPGHRGCGSPPAGSRPGLHRALWHPAPPCRGGMAATSDGSWPPQCHGWRSAVCISLAQRAPGHQPPAQAGGLPGHDAGCPGAAGAILSAAAASVTRAGCPYKELSKVAPLAALCAALSLCLVTALQHHHAVSKQEQRAAAWSLPLAALQHHLQLQGHIGLTASV